MTVELRGFSEYTLLIAKRDPGQPIVWAAFAALLAGLAVTFYLPRRRVWARLGPDGRLDLVGRSDRQVDFDREFGGLVDALVTARGAPSARLIVEQLGLDRYFGHVYAPDRTHQDYDKADFVRLAMSDASAAPHATVMVGDRADDVRAGRAHGAFTIGVEWGNGSRAELEAAGAHAVIQRVEDLVPQVESLCAV